MKYIGSICLGGIGNGELFSLHHDTYIKSDGSQMHFEDTVKVSISGGKWFLGIHLDI